MTCAARYELCVASTAREPERLDVFLHSILPGYSRARIQKLIDEKQVLVNGNATRSGYKVASRDLIEIRVPENIPDRAEPENIELDIVYEDDFLAVVNKPSGMVTHPGAGAHSNTLVNALLYHCGKTLSGISGVLRPGIVHRLDKDTSGLLVVAKSDDAHHQLARQIREKSARRVYLAVLEGVLPKDRGTIDKPIGRDPRHRKRMAIVENGRKAVSHFVVLSRSSQYSLAEITLETGRTHQIRVHMSDLGYPVVGDIVYNRKRTGTLEARTKLGITGHALHACSLSFCHPQSNELLQFKVPLPADLQRLVDTITLCAPQKSYFFF